MYSSKLVWYSGVLLQRTLFIYTELNHMWIPLKCIQHTVCTAHWGTNTFCCNKKWKYLSNLNEETLLCQGFSMCYIYNSISDKKILLPRTALWNSLDKENPYPCGLSSGVRGPNSVRPVGESIGRLIAHNILHWVLVISSAQQKH